MPSAGVTSHLSSDLFIKFAYHSNLAIAHSRKKDEFFLCSMIKDGAVFIMGLQKQVQKLQTYGKTSHVHGLEDLICLEEYTAKDIFTAKCDPY